jgi:hypothetical protein
MCKSVRQERLLSTKLVLQVCGTLVVLATGCSSPTRTGASFRLPTFSEREITSKTWTDSLGRKTQFLESSTVVSSTCGEVLVAKYGETNTHSITCLEFYEVASEPETRGLMFDPWTVSPNEKPHEAVQKVPAQKSFILLQHDYRFGMVTSIKTTDSDRRLAIDITRETVPGTATPRKGLRYRLFFAKGRFLGEDPEQGLWEIPERRKRS